MEFSIKILIFLNKKIAEKFTFIGILPLARRQVLFYVRDGPLLLKRQNAGNPHDSRVKTVASRSSAGVGLAHCLPLSFFL